MVKTNERDLKIEAEEICQRINFTFRVSSLAVASFVVAVDFDRKNSNSVEDLRVKKSY